MEKWIVGVRNWGASSQSAVGASTELSTLSRELADRIEGPPDPLPDGSIREDLSRDLRGLADVIEAQVRTLRDDYLATAASLDALGSNVEWGQADSDVD